MPMYKWQRPSSKHGLNTSTEELWDIGQDFPSLSLNDLSFQPALRFYDFMKMCTSAVCSH